MVLVFILGQTVEDMKDNGLSVNNMVKVSIYYQMVVLNMEFGKMVKE